MMLLRERTGSQPSGDRARLGFGIDVLRAFKRGKGTRCGSEKTNVAKDENQLERYSCLCKVSLVRPYVVFRWNKRLNCNDVNQLTTRMRLVFSA